MSTIVYHKSFGEGIVKSISDNLIEISFGDQVKKFQFPKAFDSFLTTADEELLSRINECNAKIKAEKEKKATSAPAPADQYTYKSNTSPRIERALNNPLVGDRAQTISVHSENEMFELVGYMAAPGRVSSIEAEVPRDGRDETFERMFPGQTYRPIELGNTPSGMPNKLSSQFRINFADTLNCPKPLLNNMGKGTGSCVGRINKSKFVLDIVQNYGFRFGDKQSVDDIRAIAVRKGFVEDFEKGFRR